MLALSDSKLQIVITAAGGLSCGQAELRRHGVITKWRG
jgi:hypothetical protein